MNFEGEFVLLNFLFSLMVLFWIVFSGRKNIIMLKRIVEVKLRVNWCWLKSVFLYDGFM